ncbi:DUF1059 domain-containing protein [Gordonia hydrophobica]|uniref:DUF1059 domain-containing protein n=1 Tax=Gordonia hydrophobica TaxID=40516 RepID=A0ABZ2U9G3_9ACTN|nr:DUF1059 domain-containing protein [Gordonia hydrophobica]MBM7365352.1 putative small metal-binding protein [Gordonia hydrophobica]
MKTEFMCPCGDDMAGADEDELVAAVKQHLADKHPDRDYTREEILLYADEA